MKRTKVAFGVLVLVVGGSSSSAAGDDKEAATREVRRLWNTEQMMRQAAENIGNRYNLNNAQREYTHRMLTTEVNRFLEEHDDIWPLIRDLARCQLRGEVPEGEMAKRLGATALPILSEAKEAILRANQQWREECLTPEQRKMHDWDLRDMEKTFSKMEANFMAMSDGTPVRQGIFPEPNTDEPQPVRPRQPSERHKPRPYAQASRARPQEDWWDNIVQDFIKRYQLDNSQSEAAFSILRDCKERARTYRESKDKEFADLAKKIAELHRSSANEPPKLGREKRRLVAKLEKRLNKPITDLYKELMNRLDPIPTDAQRLRADGKTLRRTSKDKAATEKTTKATPTPDKPSAVEQSPTVKATTQPTKQPTPQPAPVPASQPTTQTATPPERKPG